MPSHDAKLKAWLRKHPMPVAIMCDDKRVEVPKTGRPWLELHATILALAPRKLQAVGAAGEILRARDLDVDGAESGEGESETPPASDLQLFAKLLAQAHTDGSKNVEPLIGAAMAFVTQQQAHIAALQRDNDRLRQQNHRLQAELIRATSAPDGEAGEMGLIEGLMAGMAQAAATQAVPALPKAAAPNGKKG